MVSGESQTNLTTQACSLKAVLPKDRTLQSEKRWERPFIFKENNELQDAPV